MNTSYNSVRRQTKMGKDLNGNFTRKYIKMATEITKYLSA